MHILPCTGISHKSKSGSLCLSGFQGHSRETKVGFQRGIKTGTPACSLFQTLQKDMEAKRNAQRLETRISWGKSIGIFAPFLTVPLSHPTLGNSERNFEKATLGRENSQMP